MTKTAAATKEKKDATANSKQMFINKVKINNDNTASIYYRTTCDSNAQEVYYQGKEEVTEDFKSAFQNTVIGLTNLLPRLAPDSHKIQMNAIKFEYDKTEFLKSALYSAKYQFSDQTNAVINLNTPLLPIYKEGMENTFTISGKDEEALHEVIAKAKAYIKGETRTMQMKLVVDNTEEK